MKTLCQLVNCSKRIILISLAIGVVAAIIIFFVIVKDGNWRQNEMEEMRDSFDTGIVFAEQVEEQADTEEEQDPMVEIWYEPEDGKTRDQDLSFRELPDAWSTLSLDCQSKPKANQEAKQCQKTTQIVYHTPGGIASTISCLHQNFVDRLCTVRSKRASGKSSGHFASRRRWRFWKRKRVQIISTCW